jgi:hypothetical protein
MYQFGIGHRHLGRASQAGIRGNFLMHRGVYTRSAVVAMSA